MMHIYYVCGLQMQSSLVLQKKTHGQAVPRLRSLGLVRRAVGVKFGGACFEPCFFPPSPADSTFDSGQGSTVYSDSQSSQQSVVLGSLADGAPPASQCVCSPPVSVSDGPVLPHSLPSLQAYPQPATVSQPNPSGQCSVPHGLESVMVHSVCAGLLSVRNHAKVGLQEVHPCW
mgnify:FL=1